MSGQEFEQMLRRLMKQDFAAGTEAFRDALLKRCLAVLGADDEGMLVDDERLDLLAAAGDTTAFDPSALEPRSLFGDNGSIGFTS